MKRKTLGSLIIIIFCSICICAVSIFVFTKKAESKGRRARPTLWSGDIPGKVELAEIEEEYEERAREAEYVPPPKAHVDLVISRVAVSPEEVKAHVYNMLQYGAYLEEVKVSFFVGEDKFGGYAWRKIHDETIDKLYDGSQKAVDIIVPLETEDKGKTIRVVVDPEEDIEEINENNNAREGGVKRRIIHDIKLGSDLDSTELDLGISGIDT